MPAAGAKRIDRKQAAEEFLRLFVRENGHEVANSRLETVRAEMDAHGGSVAVPEPGTWAAAALLAGGAGFMRWRKRAKVL